MKQQTAVDYLAEIVRKLGYVDAGLYERIKELEKQQIIDAFKNGWNWNYDAEEYYNEKFGGEGSPTTSPNTKK